MASVLRKIWHDPVWSKVIAAIIITVFTGIIGLLWQSMGAFLLRSSAIANWLLGLLGLAILCEGAILLTIRAMRPIEPDEPTPTSRINGQDDKIQITLPRPGEILSDPKPLGSSVSYPVRGRLTFLPEGHEIWLLTADERSRKFWPQSFEPVTFDERTGEWNGRIHVGASPFRIFAVVAPPTSQDLFRYYQQRGDETRSYPPRSRIPPECLNACSVQARLP